MARPPRYGTGREWTARSVTGATTPSRTATHRHAGVAPSVAATATANTAT
jgi:hypothetical protein